MSNSAFSRWGVISGEGRPHICLALAHRDWVVACSTTRDHSLDLAGQTREILGRLEGYLNEAGTDRKRLLTAMVWLKDIRDRPTFDAVWNAWIDPDNPPARACVQADMARPDALVEIRLTAAR